MTRRSSGLTSLHCCNTVILQGSPNCVRQLKSQSYQNYNQISNQHKKKKTFLKYTSRECTYTPESGQKNNPAPTADYLHFLPQLTHYETFPCYSYHPRGVGKESAFASWVFLLLYHLWTLEGKQRQKDSVNAFSLREEKTETTYLS